jgi:hypothetical protein
MRVRRSAHSLDFGWAELAGCCGELPFASLLRCSVDGQLPRCADHMVLGLAARVVVVA